MKKLGTALLVSALLAAPASAQEIRFSYSKLFTQLKNNTAENHDDVKVSYFMISPTTGKVCKIQKAWMTKEEHYEEFSIPRSQELPLPLDNHLRKVNPDVFIVTENGEACDVSFQVLVRDKVGQEISAQQVRNWLPQMTAMMADLGGMFSSWFMPEVKGVMIHFSDSTIDHLNTSEGTYLEVSDNIAIVDVSKLAQDEVIYLPDEPLKITPWMPKS